MSQGNSMSLRYYSRNEIIAAFDPQSWQRVMFSECAAILTSESRQFPCIFGVAGFKANQLRFTFFEPDDVAGLALTLENYLKMAREYGPNTSLVAFSRPGPIANIDSYRKRFWRLLRRLAAHDRKSWPTCMTENLDDPHWEFCFAGEPIFVVCNTPAHILRQSRRASTFMVTFQPRWVFDTILNPPEKAEKAFAKVRRRLEKFDMLPPSPSLGRYGDSDVLEYQQYFIGDENERAACPFASLREPKIINPRKEENVA